MSLNAYQSIQVEADPDPHPQFGFPGQEAGVDYDALLEKFHSEVERMDLIGWTLISVAMPESHIMIGFFRKPRSVG